MQTYTSDLSDVVESSEHGALIARTLATVQATM